MVKKWVVIHLRLILKSWYTSNTKPQIGRYELGNTDNQIIRDNVVWNLDLPFFLQDVLLYYIYRILLGKKTINNRFYVTRHWSLFDSVAKVGYTVSIPLFKFSVFHIEVGKVHRGRMENSVTETHGNLMWYMLRQKNTIIFKMLLISTVLSMLVHRNE